MNARQQARRTFKVAKEHVAILRAQKKATTDPAERKALLQAWRRARADMAAARAVWHEAVDRDKIAKAPVRGKATKACPKPDGFKFLPWPKDIFRKAIDPTWEPKKSDLCMLGKYVFNTLREERAQALVAVEGRGNDAELRSRLFAYFAQPEARLYFGDVKILATMRSARCPERVDVTISTDHKQIRGFIRPQRGGRS